MNDLTVFNVLKPILDRYSNNLQVITDEDDSYYLDTFHIMNNKKPLFFGAVKINKSYVSFHLMPIYLNPSLLDNISKDLKKRMQGKSCFNFKLIEMDLIDELITLTESGYQYYVDEGYINPSI